MRLEWLPARIRGLVMCDEHDVRLKILVNVTDGCVGRAVRLALSDPQFLTEAFERQIYDLVGPVDVTVVPVDEWRFLVAQDLEGVN